MLSSVVGFNSLIWGSSFPHQAKRVHQYVFYPAVLKFYICSIVVNAHTKIQYVDDTRFWLHAFHAIAIRERVKAHGAYRHASMYGLTIYRFHYKFSLPRSKPQFPYLSARLMATELWYREGRNQGSRFPHRSGRTESPCPPPCRCSQTLYAGTRLYGFSAHSLCGLLFLW